MSPLNDIYQSIFLKILEIDRSIWIELDMGQLEKDGGTLPIKYPAVLLRFEDVVWKDTGTGIQIGLVNIGVKYVHHFTKENELMQGSVPRHEVKECLDTLQLIHDKLKDLTGPSFSQMKRFNQYYKKTHPKDLLWEIVMQYQCNIQSDGLLASPITVVDYNDIRNNNDFLERKEYNLMNK